MGVSEKVAESSIEKPCEWVCIVTLLCTHACIYHYQGRNKSAAVELPVSKFNLRFVQYAVIYIYIYIYILLHG